MCTSRFLDTYKYLHSILLKFPKSQPFPPFSVIFVYHINPMLKNVLFFPLLFICIVANTQYFSPQPLHWSDDWVAGTDYLQGKLIVKLKPGFTPDILLHSPSFLWLQQYQLSEPEQFFTNVPKPLRFANEYGQKLADLSNIHEFAIDSNADLKMVCARLKFSSAVEYVQPHFIVKPFGTDESLLTVNDPLVSSQYHLTTVNAYSGWDFQTGDSTITIAMSDGGTNLTHPDLGNIAYNYNDPIDGIDNDGDGWIDNYRGWNTGSDNNNPSYNSGGGSNHGVFTTGLAAATVNNATGVAGTSFNCRYLPVKIVNASNQWTGGEKSIYYSAMKGAFIINTSWGSTYQSPLLEDVVQFASVNMGKLIIASAGNGSPSPTIPYYPAAYELVMAVTGTDASDIKYVCGSSQSSYYEAVDLAAPGALIYSTSLASYGSGGCGTSYSAPIVSGAAALAKLKFPSYNARQIEALLKETSYNIYALAGNAAYTDKIGEGRLDMAAALAGTSNPYIYMTARNFTDGNDNQLNAGENIQLRGLFTNYLTNTSAPVSAVLSCSSPYITITDPNASLGNINSLAVINNNSDPFGFTISSSCPLNEVVTFKITFSSAGYTSSQFISLIINKDYVDITINNTWTSVCSNGRVGINDEEVTEGMGLSRNGTYNFSTAGSLMLGCSSTQVSDAAFGSSVSPFDTDFTTLNRASVVTVPVKSDFEVSGKMNDNGAGANKMNVEIDYNSYAWTASGENNFVILEYVIKNNGSSILNNFFAGLFTYWDIPNSQFNDAQSICIYDATRRMGYAYNPSGTSKYAGVKLLTDHTVNYYAFNSDGSGSSINIFDGFTSAEKFQAMSNGISRASSIAGVTSGLISSGPFTMHPGTFVKVSFALVTADNLSDLQTNADVAQLKYDRSNALWTGAVDTLWENPANWYGNITPTNTSDVVIPSVTNQPVVNSVAQIRDLTVRTGAALRIHENKSLTVSRMLIQNGSVGIRSGGGVTQTSSGLLAGTGNWRVQRRVLSPSTPFHYIGSPLNLLPLSDITNDIGGLGWNGIGSDGSNILIAADCLNLQSGSPISSVYQYTEADVTDCMFQGWEIRTSGNLTNGRGYAVVIPNNSLLDVNGIANNQTVSISGLTRTSSNVTTNQGFNQISNPYPGCIDWLSFRASNSANIQATAYLYNQGTWVTYDAFTPGQLIAPFQAFQVQTAASPGTYSATFQNSHRAGGTAAFYSDAAPFISRVSVQLTQNGKSDETRIYESDDATPNFDFNLDGTKLFNESAYPNLYTSDTLFELRYAVQALPAIHSETRIPLCMVLPSESDFSITLTGQEELAVYLHDLVTDSLIKTVPGETYPFVYQSHTDSCRFELLFKPTYGKWVDNVLTSAAQTTDILSNGATLGIALPTTPAKPERVLLTDVTGRVLQIFRILPGEIYKTIDVSMWPSGVYVLSFPDNITRKPIKIYRN